MNLPLRLAECTLQYICAKNGYCGVFADIHFAHDKWFVRCMLDILLYVKPPFCITKRWFLNAKNHTFALQKGGF